MTDSITITGVEVFAHHGVLESERDQGQVFSIDVTLELDLSSAGTSDDLADTVDYGRLASAIHELVAVERWDLIERVAQRVAEMVLEDPSVTAVTVTVHKPGAPIDVPFDDVSVTLHRHRAAARAAIALGSNVGERDETIRRAVDEIARLGDVVGVSSLYETAPMGGPPQDTFLNAVAVIDTTLGPHELLERLLAIEDAAGRQRAQRWGPRTLDLDLVTMVDGDGDGDGVAMSVDSDRLRLPHPRAAERRFVLEPLAEVWPSAPVAGRFAAEALEEVRDQEVERIGDMESHGPRGPAMASVAFVFAQVVLLAIFGLMLHIGADAPVAVTPREALGAAVTLTGVAVILWSYAALGSNFSLFPEPMWDGELVDWGPYEWVRHPMYTGVILTLLGVTIILAAKRALATTVVLAVFLWFKARYEERLLMRSHREYADFVRSVRGRLLPLGRKTLL